MNFLFVLELGSRLPRRGCPSNIYQRYRRVFDFSHRHLGHPSCNIYGRGGKNAQFGLNFLHHSTLIRVTLKCSIKNKLHEWRRWPCVLPGRRKNCTCVCTAVISAMHDVLMRLSFMMLILFLARRMAKPRLSCAMSARLSSVVLYADVQQKRTDSHKISGLNTSSQYCLVPTPRRPDADFCKPLWM